MSVLLKLTLVAEGHNDSVELPEDLQVFDNVGVLVGNQDQEEALNWHVNVPDRFSLDMRALFP